MAAHLRRALVLAAALGGAGAAPARSLRGAAVAGAAKAAAAPQGEPAAAGLNATEANGTDWGAPLSNETGASGGAAEWNATWVNVTDPDGDAEVDDIAPGGDDGVQALAAVASAGGDRVADPSQTCAASVNYGSTGCFLYRACQGRSACFVNGYLVVPGSPLRGMEDINGATAGRYDYLWSAARSQCGAPSCVLISNPVGFRTQHQMHIHYRHYNGGGAALKRRLEAALCGTAGWQPFSECGAAKARLFSGMPGVFSAVDGAYGGGSLANVGITVWFTTACGGGQQVMLLATTHCSIEHGISAR